MFITPGAPRVLIMSQSINYGFGRSLWTAFGDISANTRKLFNFFTNYSFYVYHPWCSKGINNVSIN